MSLLIALEFIFGKSIIDTKLYNKVAQIRLPKKYQEIPSSNKLDCLSKIRNTKFEYCSHRIVHLHLSFH